MLNIFCDIALGLIPQLLLISPEDHRMVKSYPFSKIYKHFFAPRLC
jgi:hypothetical protein